VTAAVQENVVSSGKNIDRLTVRTATDVNALDVLSARRVIVMQDALSVLENRLS
jgi:ribosomal protein L4